MATKKYDLAIKTGEYTNQNGETKGRYENVGAVIMGDNGPYIMLKKTFNPAGVNSDRGSIIISCFEPRQQQQPQQQQQQPQQQQAPAQPTGFGDFDDDIPFD